VHDGFLVGMPLPGAKQVVVNQRIRR
jgi:hypothetical protein